MTTGQTAFTFKTWGGRRQGAGRKRSGQGRHVPHRLRDEFRPYEPVHVTIRMAPWVWNLRSQRSFAIIHGALAPVAARTPGRSGTS